MQVVVVESPGKVKSINKYLGPGYKVMASYGHIRDLPSKDGSVKPDEDFAMSWDIDAKSAKHVKDIADAVRDADGLILLDVPVEGRTDDPEFRLGRVIWRTVLNVLVKVAASPFSALAFKIMNDKFVEIGRASCRERVSSPV